MSEHGAQQFRKGLFTPGLWRRLYDSVLNTVSYSWSAAQIFTAGMFVRYDGSMSPQTFGNGGLGTTPDGLWAHINGRNVLMAEAGYAMAQNFVGGGTISWGVVASKLKWTSRIMVIPCNKLITPSGFLSFSMPTSGVLDGAGAERANANGITLNAFDGLFAVHLPGGPSEPSYYAVRSFTDSNLLPPNWILLASAIGDDGTCTLVNGLCLLPGVSTTAADPYAATTVQAQAGADIFAYMTPARTKESVLVFAPKGQAEYWAYAAGAVSGSGSTFVNVGSNVVVTTGANDRVIATVLGNLFGNGTNFRLVRDATQILNVYNESASYSFKAGQVIDIPGAGSHTYYLQINNPGSTWGYQMPASLVVEVTRQ